MLSLFGFYQNEEEVEKHIASLKESLRESEREKYQIQVINVFLIFILFNYLFFFGIIIFTIIIVLLLNICYRIHYARFM
jgi:hypothetical protein